MNVADLFRAFLSLGLPVAALSWVLFSWIFSSGEIGCSEKRAAIKKQVKNSDLWMVCGGKRDANSFLISGLNLAPAFMVWLVSGH